MSTDPSYVAAQTGLTVGTMLTEQPLEPLLAAAKAEVIYLRTGWVALEKRCGRWSR